MSLVIVGTPCFGGLVSQNYALSLLGLMASCYGSEVDFSAILLGHEALITRGRSTIVGMFMDNPAATHLLFVDADISFDPDSVMRMLGFDKEFVAGMYPAKATDWERMPLDGETRQEASLAYVGELCAGDALRVDRGFATATYAGGGFQLIKRSVFRRMFEAYPQLKYEKIDTFTKHPPSGNRYALFDCMIEDRTYLSEDFSFCKRWRAIGGEIWLDLRSRLGHHSGAYNYCGNAEARYQSLLRQPAGSQLLTRRDESEPAVK